MAVNDGVGQAGDGGNFNATYGRDLPGSDCFKCSWNPTHAFLCEVQKEKQPPEVKHLLKISS